MIKENERERDRPLDKRRYSVVTRMYPQGRYRISRVYAREPGPASVERGLICNVYVMLFLGTLIHNTLDPADLFSYARSEV